MSLRAPLFVCALFLLLASARASGEKEKKPDLLHRTLQIFHFGSHADKDSVHAKNLTLSMELAPLPVKLSETRQIKVSLSLTNHTKQFVHLEFPTAQRIELLIHDKNGKLVTQWSEDQSFANEAAYVTVNPGERIEYNAMLATRDLTAGESYSIEGFFPNFKDLTIQKTIVPEK